METNIMNKNKNNSNIHLFLLFLFLTRSDPRVVVVAARTVVFDVTEYGAIPDGQTDMSQALSRAFEEACEFAAATARRVVVPAGDYVLGITSLRGPCKGPIGLQVDGYVRAPPEMEGDGWVTFSYMDGFNLSGKGTFDGQGRAAAWRKNDCRTNKHCKKLPYNLRFNFINQATVQGLTSKDSKSFNFNLLGCNNFTVSRFRILAPADSPNTDGIHVGKSSGVAILDSVFQTGDDCISIGDGVRQLTVERVRCGPGHGVSIGSLGGSAGEEPVVGVHVRNCSFVGTENGVRIKTKPGSNVGAVRDVVFEDLVMENARNPIVVDQVYCPANLCANKNPSMVAIKNVTFKNIKGTSASEEAITLKCSPAVPCEEVELEDIDLKYYGPRGPEKAVCSNVKPNIIGPVNPVVNC